MRAASVQPRGFERALLTLALAYLLVFAGLPLLYNLLMSFQQIDALDPGAWWQRAWVGWDHYRDVLSRPEARGVLANTAQFVALSLVFQVGLGLALAVLFQQSFPGATLMRGLFLAGWIMPGLVAGVIWKLLFAGDFGVVNHALLSLGLAREALYWLSDARYALYAIVIANVWLGVPFNMLLLSAGLAQIPHDLYEAAELDGAQPWQRFVWITVPMMASTLGAVIALGVILTVQQFDLVAALTQGGPANASQVAQYWSWQMSFQTFEVGPGAAVASLMLVVVVATAVAYVRSTRREQRA